MREDDQGHVYFRFAPTKQTTWQDPRLLPHGWSQQIDNHGMLYFSYKPARATCWLDPRGMPSNWLQVMVPENPNPVFVHEPTGKHTNVDPRGLPPGFSQAIDLTSDRVYFQNHSTRSTQWEDPRDSLPPEEVIKLRNQQREEWYQVALANAVAVAEEEKRAQDSKEEAGSFDKIWERRMDEMLNQHRAVRAQKESEWSVFAESREVADRAALAELNAAAAELETKLAEELKVFDEEYQRKRVALLASQDSRRETLYASQQARREQVSKESDKWRHEFEQMKQRELEQLVTLETAQKQNLQQEMDSQASPRGRR